MRVLYDSIGFCEAFGGVSHSFAELIRHLPADVEGVLAVERTCNVYLQQAPFDIPSYPNQYENFIASGNWKGKWRLWTMAQKYLPSRFPDYERINADCLARHFEEGDFDVLHLTGPHAPGEAWRKVVGRKPIVLTVHDLIPELFQNNALVAASRREILSAATHVIAVSEQTKRDLVRLYDADEDKITVVYHGYEKGMTAEGTRLPIGPYLLYVGKRAGYKNWTWFVEAVAPVLRERHLKLVCTGTPFTWSERRLLRKLDLTNRVEQRFVSSADLLRLYAGASAFVSPSRYEGFGLPILEAWGAGCPVVLANASCAPEIAGEAATYFELDDPKSLREAIFQALTGRTRPLGAARLQRYTWERCAQETAAVYRRALKCFG